MISLKFIKSSLIYTLAGSLPMASALILLPFYIAYLPTDVYGALSICLSVSVLFQVIATYSFDTSLYVHYHEFKDDPSRLSQFISSVFLFMLLLGGGVIFIFGLIGPFLFKVFLPGKTFSFYPYGIISIATGVFQAIFKVYSNLLQSREKPATFFWSNVVSFSIIVITTIIGLKLFPATLAGPMGARLLSACCLAIWTLVSVFREFGIHLQSPWRLTSFSFNAYTFVYQLQQWAINYLDRFLILFFMPISSVGIYDFALKCVVPIELILNGLNASINPKVVSLLTKQKIRHSTPELNRYFYGLVAIILLLICAVIMVVPIALDIFTAKSGYHDSLKYIPFVALVYIFKSQRLYFVMPFAVLKKMKTLTALNFGVTMLKVLLMIWLIQRWEIYGLIAATLSTYAIELVLLWHNLKDHYKMNFNFVKLFIVPFILLFTILIGEWFYASYNPMLWHFGYGALCFLLLLVAFRNELKVFKSLKLF